MAERGATQVELRAEWLVRSALGHIQILEDLDFGLTKVSLKAFELPVLFEAYRRFAALPNDYPLHLGVTEAGTPRAGSVRSATGIGTLLALGIGDTIRVSLTTDPVEEVFVAYEILKSLELRQKGAVMIACPTCGRVEVDLFTLANQVDEFLTTVTEPIRVAVMGCVVNGPGESRDADVGLAAGNGKGVIFRKGKIVRTVAETDMLAALKDEIRLVVDERQSGVVEEVADRYQTSPPFAAPDAVLAAAASSDADLTDCSIPARPNAAARRRRDRRPVQSLAVAEAGRRARHGAPYRPVLERIEIRVPAGVETPPRLRIGFMADTHVGSGDSPGGYRPCLGAPARR